LAVPAAFAFFLHSRRRQLAGAQPVLDLTLLRHRTYRGAMLGGSLMRLAMGGSPYLLALLMQVGLGWSALQTGLIIIAAAAGSLGARPFGPWLIGKVGFRWLLIGSALTIALLGVAPALFRNATPIWLIMGVLFLTGYARALQFTSVNALSYADVPEHRVSAAATLSAVMQQITLSLGISLAAFSLHFGDLLHAGPLNLTDFAISFSMISFFALMAVPVYAALPHSAGADMSGHKLRD
jgi:MFS family permease